MYIAFITKQNTGNAANFSCPEFRFLRRNYRSILNRRIFFDDASPSRTSRSGYVLTLCFTYHVADSRVTIKPPLPDYRYFDNRSKDRNTNMNFPIFRFHPHLSCYYCQF